MALADKRREREDAERAAAFWEKLDPSKAKLYNFIRKSLGFSVESDDVYQETVLRAFQYVRTYQEGRSFEAWLFGIAHNEIRKHFRKSSRVPVTIEIERWITADNLPDRILAGEVYRVAENLKPRFREVFFLFYDAEFSIKDISRITGLREGNVKLILNRIRKILKARLGASHGR